MAVAVAAAMVVESVVARAAAAKAVVAVVAPHPAGVAARPVWVVARAAHTHKFGDGRSRQA